MDKGLRLEKLTVSLLGKRLVSVNERVKQGEILALMGPSGSGKSSLLNFIIGDLDESFEAEGNVFLNGQNITSLPTQKREIGVLFQDHILFPHLSVAENLAFAVPSSVKKAARKQKVETALEHAGLEGFGDHDPAKLSGGQAARIALMRTLLAEPKAVLLDEPFSRLDQDRRASIRDFVYNEVREKGLPTLVVTHDEQDAFAADRMISL